VAVLTLAAPVQYSHKIKPVCLPSSPGRDYGGSIAVAAGFGLVDVSDGPEKAKNYLMKNVETLHSDEECMMYECPLCGVRCYEKGRLPPRCAHMMDNVNILCSHEPGTGTTIGHTIRKGDSGSALNLKENGRYSAVGVASYSWGDDSIRKDFPRSMWAKIRPDIKEWIQTIATDTQDSDCGQ